MANDKAGAEMENGEKKRKTDRRTKYTTKAIQDAYIALLKKKPRQKIKITDICSLAEINRCTFYLHYESVDDVERAIKEELLSKFTAYVQMQRQDSSNRLNLSNLFNQQIIGDESYVTLMRLSTPEQSFVNDIKPIFKQDLLDSLPKNTRFSERQAELLYHFIVGGVSAVQQEWIRTGNTQVEEDNQLLDQLVRLAMSVNPDKL